MKVKGTKDEQGFSENFGKLADRSVRGHLVMLHSSGSADQCRVRHRAFKVSFNNLGAFLN